MLGRLCCFSKKIKKQAAFTLIELLIVISIIAILIAVIFATLNPLRLFAESRNAQRWMQTSELLTAIHIYVIQNLGKVPNQEDWREGIHYMLGTGTFGCNVDCGGFITSGECLNLTDLVEEKHISAIPQDPENGNAQKTGIYVYREEGTIITVGMCNDELGENISLTR